MKATLDEMMLVSRKVDEELTSYTKLSGMGEVYEVVRAYPENHPRFANLRRLSFEFENGYIVNLSNPIPNTESVHFLEHELAIDRVCEMERPLLGLPDDDSWD